MSKSYYMQCKLLHALPKFTSTMQRVQAGNGQCVSVLFVILVVIDVYGNRFEVFTLVSEIPDSVDLVLDMKKVFEHYTLAYPLILTLTLIHKTSFLGTFSRAVHLHWQWFTPTLTFTHTDTHSH